MRLSDELRFELTRAALTGMCGQVGLPGTPKHRNAMPVAEDVAQWAVMIADATLTYLERSPLRTPPSVLHSVDCAVTRYQSIQSTDCTCGVV